MNLEEAAVSDFFRKAKAGDKYSMPDGAVYEMVPGSYANVAGQEEDPFIQAYLNSIDNGAMGRKFYPMRLR